MEKKKRRSSREIVESEKDPDLEHAYIKYPGEEMKEVTLVNTKNRVWSNPYKISKLWMQHNKRKYSDIHTHPGNWTALPSYEDISDFLTNSHAKSMIIFAPSDESYDHYFVMKKTKNTLKSLPFLDSIRALFGLHPLLKSYKQTTRKRGHMHDVIYPSTSLKDIAERYELNYRMVPYGENSRNSLGIRLFNEFGRPIFFKKKTTLERKVTHFIIVLSALSIGLILISSNLSSGNVQLSPGGNIFNWRLLSGIGLFIIGLVGGYFWFRKRKSSYISLKGSLKGKAKKFTRKEREEIMGNENRWK
ncbi:MAG: hypothetical protein WC584_04700 [Candidatus Pacearchaeota archaeon]